MKLTVGPLPPAVYWRRRVLVLAGLLVVVLAIAYACHGAASNAEGQKPTAVTTSTTPAPEPSTTPPSAAPSQSPSIVPSTPPSTVSVAPQISGECADAELTVTVGVASTSPTVTRLQYGGTFAVRLVVTNVSTRTCTRDVGSVPEELIIKRGTTKIWSSDDCASPNRVQHDVRTFHPGDVVVATIKWSSFSITTNGCTKATRPAQIGTYTLTGRVDTKFSQPVTFKIEN